jgi:hypothetical protein
MGMSCVRVGAALLWNANALVMVDVIVSGSFRQAAYGEVLEAVSCSALSLDLFLNGLKVQRK